MTSCVTFRTKFESTLFLGQVNELIMKCKGIESTSTDHSDHFIAIFTGHLNAKFINLRYLSSELSLVIALSR